jgi:hypothetical protein
VELCTWIKIFFRSVHWRFNSLIILPEKQNNCYEYVNACLLLHGKEARRKCILNRDLKAFYMHLLNSLTCVYSFVTLFISYGMTFAMM